MLGKYKNIIIVVAIVVIGFVLYSIFIKPDPEAESLLKTSGYTEVDVLGEDIVKALNQINSIDLDNRVLSDPIIRALTDYSREIEEEPAGKKNPFAPIDAEAEVEEVEASDEDAEEVVN